VNRVGCYDIVRIVCVMMSAERIRAQISNVIHSLRVVGFGDRTGGLCLRQKRLEACESSHCSHGTAVGLADFRRRQRATRLAGSLCYCVLRLTVAAKREDPFW